MGPAKVADLLHYLLMELDLSRISVAMRGFSGRENFFRRL
jgi:hypothetical protein